MLGIALLVVGLVAGFSGGEWEFLAVALGLGPLFYLAALGCNGG